MFNFFKNRRQNRKIKETKALQDEKSEMISKLCPINNGDTCSTRCVHFKEIEVKLPTVSRLTATKPICRLWNYI